MADHQELIANFVGVVDSTPEQAQFYLEANNWDLNEALSNFYEEPEAASAAGANTGSSASKAEKDEDDDDDLKDIIARTAPKTSSSSEGKRKANAGSSRKQGGIATFRDLNKDEDSDEEDSDEDSQNFFAGGEKSGVMVQGPPGKKDSNALVEDILKKAA
ncbi:hypothetical protein BX616_005557, partial [Lobosporangium transversale]